MNLPFDYRLVEKVEFVYPEDVNEQLAMYDEQIKETEHKYFNNYNSHSTAFNRNDLVQAFINEVKPIEEAKVELLTHAVPCIRLILRESATLY